MYERVSNLNVVIKKILAQTSSGSTSVQKLNSKASVFLFSIAVLIFQFFQTVRINSSNQYQKTLLRDAAL